MEGSEERFSWLGQVLPEPYKDMMRQYLMRSADEVCNRSLAPYSRQAWEIRRQQILRDLIAALGGFPERTPLNARVTSTHQRDGYRIENVVFESRPSFYVTGSVFVPDNLKVAVPAVLCPHGHWQRGRYQEQVVRRCVGLARRGYVTFSVDAVGYNDRLPMGHRQSWYLFSTGLTLQGIQVWDNIRAIDYLCSRDDVDPERIGCTGASGGGNQTMYVSALDERIKAAVPVCSVETISDYMEKGFCTCETIPGLVQVADLTEITALIAPRALLLIHGILDSGFPILSARRAAAKLAEVYRFYDRERFAAFESYAPHDYNAEMRQAMYAWFDRWLMGHNNVMEQEAEENVDESLLRVLPTGLPEGHATLVTVFEKELAKCPPPPEVTSAQEWHAKRQVLFRELCQAFCGLPLRSPVQAHIVETGSWRGYRTEKLWFRSEQDVIVPAVILLPNVSGPCDANVYLLENGKQDLSETEALAHLEAGEAVFAFDQRDTGETLSGRDHISLSAIALGRPLASMHAWDLVRSIDYLCQRRDIAGVKLIARGSLATNLSALLAAIADKRVQATHLEQLPATLRVASTAAEMRDVYLSDILAVADIPALAAMVAPRLLKVASIVDGDVQPVSAADADAAFKYTAHVYELLGATHAFSVH